MQSVKRRGFGNALLAPPCVQKLSELKVGWGHPGQVLWPTARGKQDEGALRGGSLCPGIRGTGGAIGVGHGHSQHEGQPEQGHVESTRETLSVAWAAGRGHGEKSGRGRRNDQENWREGLGADDK